jgi:hypothetical protein
MGNLYSTQGFDKDLPYSHVVLLPFLFSNCIHRWAWTLAFMSAVSNIDISSDIGTKYVRLNPLIPISEEFPYRHQLPFRYRTKLISDIPISKIKKSFPYDPSKILLVIILFYWSRTHNLHAKYLAFYHYVMRVY